VTSVASAKRDVAVVSVTQSPACGDQGAHGVGKADGSIVLATEAASWYATAIRVNRSERTVPKPTLRLPSGDDGA
jgi:hypothetical protein